jgi:hypothetical protein
MSAELLAFPGVRRATKEEIERSWARGVDLLAMLHRRLYDRSERVVATPAALTRIDAALRIAIDAINQV